MPGHLPTHLLPETVVKLHSAAAAAALALVLTGCSTVVEFASDIEGARVTSADGTTAGITPVQVTYDNDALDAARRRRLCGDCRRNLHVALGCKSNERQPHPALRRAVNVSRASGAPQGRTGP